MTTDRYAALRAAHYQTPGPLLRAMREADERRYALAKLVAQAVDERMRQLRAALAAQERP